MKKFWIILLCTCLLSACSSQRIETSRLEKLCGSIVDNNYINAYFSISATFGDDWEFSVVEDNQENGSSFVVFYAQKDYGLQSVNVTIEDINYNEGEENLIDIVWDSLKKDLIKSNVEIIDSSKEDSAYKGYPAAKVSINGVVVTNENEVENIFTKHIILQKNRYVAIITVTSIKEDYTEEIISCFNHLNV